MRTTVEASNRDLKPMHARKHASSRDTRARVFLRAVSRCLNDGSGVAAVEFALVAPLLLGIALAALIFALALNNYILVTNGSAAGVTNLILSRGSSTPYTDTVTAVRQAAQGLVANNLTIAMSVDGAACSDDATCATALGAAGGRPASVAVSYPCRLVVLDIDYAPGSCVLRQTTSGRVQ